MANHRTTNQPAAPSEVSTASPESQAAKSGPGPVPPETPGAAIIADEERLYARVQARIALGDDDVGERVDASDIDRELISLRDQIAEAKPEDLAPLVEQMTRMAALRSRLGGSRTLPIDQKSPYFAHMVLSEGKKSRDVLVGKRGFIDRSSNVQIVDWRNAPISRIYYRYEEGDDYEEEIAGRRVDGIVEVRRNISIFGGKLRRIGAPQGTFIRDVRNVWHQAIGQAAPVLRGGQGKAVRVPRARPPRHGDRNRGRGRDRRRGRDRDRNRRERSRLGVHHGSLHRADKSLPEIAALIDREQFDLITQPNSGMVVIQGGAGSGKTTVALHRIAYLNFADRRRFKPSAILFVVPSPSLVKYVAGVLPALGVHGVPVVTYERWARTQRLKLLRGSSGKYNDDTPDTVSRIKKHPALLPMLETYVAEQIDTAERVLIRATERFGAAGDRVAETVSDAWRGLADQPLLPRLTQLGRWARDQRELPAKARVAVDSAVKRLRRRAADILTDWSEILTDYERLRAGFDQHDGGDPVTDSEIRQAVSWCARQAAGAEEQPTDLDGNPMSAADGNAVSSSTDGEPGGQFDPEDDPILLRLIQLKRGRLVSPDGHEIIYEHVAIDEAQDRSAIEVKVLFDATRMVDDDPTQRSITVAGDTAQRIVFDNSFSGWQELMKSTGHAAIIRPLKLSYRSTAEVMHFAREILGPDLAPEDPLVARSGEAVELHQFGDIGEAVAFLADALRGLAAREPTASVAIITRHSETADAYFAGLSHAEVPALRRVRHHDFTFAPGIDITNATQVKGLEFDYVIMADVTAASYPATIESRHLLHIGATRAAHQLWLISAGDPSPLLPAELTEGGIMLAPPPAELE